jgi:hypothetical protein
MPPTVQSRIKVGERDRQVELAEPAQNGEQPDARGGADQAADQQHQGERHVERAPPPVAQGAEKEEAATWLATLATATAG